MASRAPPFFGERKNREGEGRSGIGYEASGGRQRATDGRISLSDPLHIDKKIKGVLICMRLGREIWPSMTRQPPLASPPSPARSLPLPSSLSIPLPPSSLSFPLPHSFDHPRAFLALWPCPLASSPSPYPSLPLSSFLWFSLFLALSSLCWFELGM